MRQGPRTWTPFANGIKKRRTAVFELQRKRTMAIGDEIQADVELHQGLDVIIKDPRTEEGMPYKAVKPLIAEPGSLADGDRLSHKTTRAIQTEKAG